MPVLRIDVVPQGALKTGKLLKTRTEENYANEGMSRLPAEFRPKIPQTRCPSHSWTGLALPRSEITRPDLGPDSGGFLDFCLRSRTDGGYTFGQKVRGFKELLFAYSKFCQNLFNIVRTYFSSFVVGHHRQSAAGLCFFPKWLTDKPN